MKCLILFSGTRSFERVLEMNKENECRGVDLDNHFKPFYNVDILKWDYEKDLKDWVPDYLHSSPVCKNFTPLKMGIREPTEEEIRWSVSLVQKTLDIIGFIKSMNPNLKFTIENPRGKMKHLEMMKPIKSVRTSYCKYGFPYSKPTDFWFGGFDLELIKCCSHTKTDKNWCDFMKKNKGIHPVRIGYKGSFNSKTRERKVYDNQVMGVKYFKQLRIDNPKKYSGYTDTYFRYRIPQTLIKDIVEQL